MSDFNVQTALIDMEHRLTSSITALRIENKADHEATIRRLDAGAALFEKHTLQIDRIEQREKGRARRSAAAMMLTLGLLGESAREHWHHIWRFLAG